MRRDGGMDPAMRRGGGLDLAASDHPAKRSLQIQCNPNRVSRSFLHRHRGMHKEAKGYQSNLNTEKAKESIAVPELSSATEL